MDPSSTVLTSWIDGEWRTGDALAQQFNPARPGEVVSCTSRAGAALAGEAVAGARAAAAGWARRPARERGEILRRTAELLGQRAERIGADLSREEGKTRAEAVGETLRAAEVLRYFAAQATFEPDGSTFPSGTAGELLYARRVAVGVVAAITPWNFPIAIPAWKLGPALAYGNAVVWKPAELVPCTSVHLMQAFADAGIPAGVLQLLLGRGSEVGSRLVGEQPAAGAVVDAVTFTGSNHVGRRIIADACAAGQRVQLELGGSNASIVLADADLPRAADAVARGAFLSAGQKCTATSRIIVERAVLDAFTALLVEATDRLVVGDPLHDGVDVGPLSSEAAAAEVREQVAAGVAQGRRLTRRAPDDVPPGAFVAPTLLADLPADSALLHEEVFGPVAAVLAAEDPDHALALADATRYGLVASVFTRDVATALRFADELDVGMVKVNQQSPGNEVHVPFGGTKLSSYGPGEQGKAAREFFTHWKTVYIDRG